MGVAKQQQKQAKKAEKAAKAAKLAEEKIGELEQLEKRVSGLAESKDKLTKKIGTLRAKKHEAALVGATLQSFPHNVGLWKQCGRAFIRSNRNAIENELENTINEVNASLPRLEITDAQFECKLKQETSNMMELQRDFNKLGLQVGRMTGPGENGEGVQSGVVARPVGKKALEEKKKQEREERLEREAMAAGGNAIEDAKPAGSSLMEVDIPVLADGKKSKNKKKRAEARAAGAAGGGSSKDSTAAESGDIATSSSSKESWVNVNSKESTVTANPAVILGSGTAGKKDEPKKWLA